MQPGEKEGVFLGDAASITVDSCKTDGGMSPFSSGHLQSQSHLQDASVEMQR